jgi:hypothetical protein
LIVNLGLKIKNGRSQCKKCGATFGKPFPEIEKFCKKFKIFIQDTCFYLYNNGISFGSIAEYITKFWNIDLSPETAREHYVNECMEHKDKKVSSTSGIFHIDCQHLTENKNKRYRLSIIDAKTKKCIVDVVIFAETNKDILDRVRLHLLPYKIKGFIVDGKLGLKHELEDEFNVPVQLCITHFQALIVNDYIKAYGKNMPLLVLRNLYMSLDILMSHNLEFNFLNRKVDQLTKFKQSIICSNTNLYELSVKSRAKQLKSEFYEFRISLKKYRRKNHPYLIRNSESEIKQKLEHAKQFLTEPVQLKALERIENNFESLTHFLRIEDMPPTNGGVEHYYSDSLTKSQKKKFRSLSSIKHRLTASKSIRNNWFNPSASLIELFNFYAELFVLFGKPG